MMISRLFILWPLTALVALFLCGPLQAQKTLAGKRTPVVLTEESAGSSAMVEPDNVIRSEGTALSLYIEVSPGALAQESDCPSCTVDSRHGTILRI